MTADDFVILNDGVHSSCEDAGTTSLSESECREANAALASDVSWGSMPSHQLIGYGDDDTLTSTYPLKCLLVQTVNPEYADHDADPYDTRLRDNNAVWLPRQCGNHHRRRQMWKDALCSAPRVCHRGDR